MIDHAKRARDLIKRTGYASGGDVGQSYRNKPMTMAIPSRKASSTDEAKSYGRPAYLAPNDDDTMSKTSTRGFAKGGWIKGAIKHPGALHKELGVPEGEKIPTKKLDKAAHASGKLGRRARLAKTLKGLG